MADAYTSLSSRAAINLYSPVPESTDPYPGALLDEVRDIAQAASRRASRVRREDFRVTRKEDGSPVTTADLQTHEEILSRLKALVPTFPVLSEEGELVSFAGRRGWERYWLVDPIDGTRELVSGSPDFTVNIALVCAGRPVLGVIQAPATGISYFAAVGRGAFRQGPGGSCKVISTRRTRADHLRVVCSKGRYSRKLESFLHELGGEVELDKMGSSLKSCRVAEGDYDVSPQFGRTYEWDTAAAQCILEEAGGMLVDTDLRPLRYNTGEDLVNPPFLAIADPRFPWRAYLPSSVHS